MVANPPHQPNTASPSRPSVLIAFRRFWWVMVLCAAGVGILGALPQPAKQVDSTTSYRATYAMLLNTDDLNGVSNNSLVNQLSFFATFGEVPIRVAKQLDKPDTEGASLASQVTVTVDLASQSVTITATQATPEAAVDLVNAFGEQLTTFIAERQDDIATARINRLLKRLTDLEKRIRDLQTDLAGAPEDEVTRAKLDAAAREFSVITEQYDNLQADPSTLTLIELQRGVAVPLTSSSGLAAPKSRFSRGALAALAGLFVGGFLAVLLARLDRRIRSREHAEIIFGGPTSVGIPVIAGRDVGIEVLPDRHDLLSDSYRTLRSVISFAQSGLPSPETGHRARVTLVVSASAGDGKTSVAVNLAAAFAENGRRVIVVNTDFRRPTIGKRLNAQTTLPYALEDLPTTSLREIVQRTTFSNLALVDLHSVKASPSDLVRATTNLLPEIISVADAVVIDTSPVGLTAEVLDLVPLADTIVMVIRLGNTPTSAAYRTMELLRTVGTGTFHLALVGESAERSPYYEYYATATPPPEKAKPSRRK